MATMKTGLAMVDKLIDQQPSKPWQTSLYKWNLALQPWPTIVDEAWQRKLPVTPTMMSSLITSGQ